MWCSAVLLLLLLLLGPPVAEGQSAPRSLVAVSPRTPWTLRELEQMQLDLVSYDPDTGVTYLTVTPEEQQSLIQRGFAFATVELDARAGLRRLQMEPDLGLYHTFAETENELQDLQSTYSHISELEVLGHSIEGRPIYALKISDEPSIDDTDEPDVLIVGNHHARELMSVEVPLYFARLLLEGYTADPEIRRLVDERQTWIVPLLNPDGHVFQETFQRRPGWRKNRRQNLDGTFGVDLNRNYSYLWGFDDEGSSPGTLSETYRGTGGFSEPETDAIRRLVERQNFKISLSYHSFGNLLLYPWGWTRNELTADHDVYVALGDSMVRENGYRPGNAAMGNIYVTNGAMGDYMYGELTPRKGEPTFAFTVELNSQAEGGFWPPDDLIEPTCELLVPLNLFALRVAGNLRAIVPPPQPQVTATQDPLEPWRIELSWQVATDFNNPIDHFEVFEIDPSGAGKALQHARAVELRQAGRATLLSDFGVPEHGILAVRLETVLEPLWDYVYVEARVQSGAWQALSPQGGSNLNPTGRNQGHGITGARIPRLLHFDAGAFAGERVEVSLRLDPYPGTRERPWVRAEVDFPATLTETRRVIAPNVQDTRYTVLAERTGLFGYGVTAVDADGQTIDSPVFWFHIDRIVAVDVADVELTAFGKRLALSWQSASTGAVRFAAWSRRLAAGETPLSRGHEWEGGAYIQVAEALVRSNGTVALSWHESPGRYAVLLSSEDADGARIWGPWIAEVRGATRLHPAAPNPFNPQTRLRFELSRSGFVRLDVVSIDGRLVRQLVAGDLSAGEHSVPWNGLDDQGRAVASGVYIATLQQDVMRDTERLVILR